MEKFRIQKEIRNEFFFKTVYSLFYPAVLGTIFVYSLQGIFNGDILNIGLFSIMSLGFLIWYFILDFYVGLTNFEEDKKSYDFRYLLCDLVIIVVAFLAFFGLWFSKDDTLFYVSVLIFGFILLLLDYFNSIDENSQFSLKDSYNLMLIILCLISIGMIIASFIIAETQTYTILKYTSVLLFGIGIVYYTFYILSDNSFEE